MADTDDHPLRALDDGLGHGVGAELRDLVGPSNGCPEKGAALDLDHLRLADVVIAEQKRKVES